MSESKHSLFPDSKIDTVADNTVVVIHYCLKNDDGEVIQDSFEDEPIAYLHGYGNIVPGLENALKGKKVGDRLQVDVAPEDGYGESSEDNEVLDVPRDSFPPEIPLIEGLPVPAEIEDGSTIVYYIVGHDDENIYLSDEHPLAGETLHFDVEVMGVREPTKKELKHGHPHGIDGTEVEEESHGCGCGGCGCSGD